MEVIAMPNRRFSNVNLQRRRQTRVLYSLDGEGDARVHKLLKIVFVIRPDHFAPDRMTTDIGHHCKEILPFNGIRTAS